MDFRSNKKDHYKHKDFKQTKQSYNNGNSQKGENRDRVGNNKEDFSESDSYIFGRNAIVEALNQEGKISKVYLMFGVEGPNIDKITSLCYKSGTPIVKHDKRKFLELESKIGAKGNSQGVIALNNPIDNLEYEDLFDTCLAESDFPLIIALDEINDPHNLGAISRSLVCSGANGLLLPKSNSVQITPTAIKISAGSLLQTRISQVKSLLTSLEYAKTLGFQVIGTEMKAEKNYFDVTFRQPTIIVIGSEGKGIRPSIKHICSEIVKIPMVGEFNSLNASVSAGILLFEAAKQKMF